MLRKLTLTYSTSDGHEYHHVGPRMKIVLFYHFNTDLLSGITNEDIQKANEAYNAKKEKKRADKYEQAIKDSQIDGKWKAQFTKRSFDGKYKREVELTGTVEKGWFIIDPDTSDLKQKKLYIHGKDFTLLERIE